MLNFSEKEKDILGFWQQNDIFKKSLAQESPRGDYVFYDGPPFATGLPHYGHILSSVIKDVVPRYWTMRGYHVRRRWGWDCHGLPIENLVEQKLGLAGKKDIEKIGVDVFNETCRQEVLTYATQWKEMVDRIGRWVEFDNSYKTMEATYMESVWWALKTMWGKGLIYQGHKVLLYCPRCETPVSKFEVAMDNSYQEAIDDAVTIKFKLLPGQTIGDFKTDDQTYILAWTTTPWTLPGNVALAIAKDIDYVLVSKSDGESLILAKNLLEKFIEDKYPIHDFKGQSLVNLNYEPLYEISAVLASGKRAFYITPADFVTTEEGTGVVHTAVIYGEDDYNLGVKIDLPMVPLLNNKGIFNEQAPELIRGLGFKESEAVIMKDLTERSLLYRQEKYSHPYPHCWRCDKPLFYNAIEAWFVDIQKIKSRLIELNKKINWYPKHLKLGRFLNNLESAPDWNISRNRYWATALPFWRCSNPKCKEMVCLGSVEELKKKALNFSEVYKTDNIEQIDLHKHLLDKIKLKCQCGGEMIRIPEVIDCWVESASMPFAEFHYPFENKKVFESRFPGQYIAEYIAQTRAWFYYMHVMATALFDNVSFTNVVTTGTILNKQGEKLSKSKKNYPDPWQVINAYGADSLRFYLLGSVVMQAENLDFDEAEVRQIYNKVINTLLNVLNFYLLYHDEKLISPKTKSGDILDIWILSKVNRLVEEVTQSMDDYNTIKSTKIIAGFIDELSTWYVRRSRNRFKDLKAKVEAVNTLHQVLVTLAKVIAPFLPFSAEHLWQSLQMTEKESVHLAVWPTADKKLMDNKVFQQMEVIKNVAEKAHALRAKKAIKVRQPLATLEIDLGAKIKLEEPYLAILQQEINVEQVKIVNEITKAEGWETENLDDLTISLDTNYLDNKDLQDKGNVRELIRSINSLRKEAGLQASDRPLETYQTDSIYLKELIARFKEELMLATSAGDLKESKTKLKISKEFEINKEKIILGLK
jgi:isoleucyl-tRNA synthetase